MSSWYEHGRLYIFTYDTTTVLETNLSVTTAERRGYISDSYSESLGLGHREAIRI
jgi:hypothetical protein